MKKLALVLALVSLSLIPVAAKQGCVTTVTHTQTDNCITTTTTTCCGAESCTVSTSTVCY